MQNLAKTEFCILDDAQRYLDMGLSVIPIAAGTKKPPKRFQWKQYQSRRMSEQQARDIFLGRDDISVAVVGGAVSGGVYFRDFDQRDAYDCWKASHKSLAKSIPTVETYRGFHLWARFDGVCSRNLPDGELRSEGNYVLAPHSKHPDGGTYRWINQPKSLDSIPVLDPAEFGITPALGSATDRDRIGYLSDLCLSVPICGNSFELLEGTIPPAYGTRRSRIFEVARRIKSDHSLRDKPVSEFRPLIREWHQLALPTIRTKGFDETWLDFVEAISNVDPALCNDAALMALERVEANPLPRAAHDYDSPIVQMLVALCYQLSMASTDGVFYLSCRKAAAVLGTSDFKLIARWLRVLCADGVLSEITKGTASKATRYNWLKGNA